MIYCDTSLIVTALTAEERTSDAQQWLARHDDGDLCASLWVETEIASALAQKQRTKLLTEKQRVAAFRGWRELVAAWRMLVIEARHFTQAADLTTRGLRAGDALHLALARDAGAAIATRDDDLARVADEMQLKTFHLD